MISSEYRHVCYKDLDRFFKKDKYFSDLTEEEKNKIKENLGISDAASIIVGTYEELEKLVTSNKLLLGQKYLLTDFQTIYSIEYEVVGTDDSRFPSHTYAILLTAVGVNAFDPKVILLSEDGTPSHLWEVRYDFTKTKLIANAYNKGQITYLKDEFNNSAYFDFKNIRIKHNDTYYYTFDMDGEDASSSGLVTDVTLGQGCDNNIFIGETCNVYLEANCVNNLFLGGQQLDCHLLSDSVNNVFHVSVVNLTGRMSELNINDDLFSNPNISKNIIQVDNKHILSYLDQDTLTMQYKELE